MLPLRSVMGWSGLTALLLAPSLWADESTRWLERMAQATSEQSYYGAYVYERSGVFTTQNIWRKVGPDGTFERLQQTAGRNQEWFREDGQLVCASSITRAVNSGTPVLDTDPSGLKDWYSLRVLGGTMIASRPVTVIALTPRDAYRYAYELYLDNETGLMLKSLLVDDKRELLERFQFASVAFDEPSSEALQPSSSCLTVEQGAELPEQRANYWEPAWLPPGFSLGHQQVQAIQDSDLRITSQIYTDGLARFTLFVEPLGQDGLAEDLRAQLGPTVAVSRRLMTRDKLYLATVVGEIPPMAAERIAESLSEAIAGASHD